MALPSTVDFHAGQLDYIAELDALVADINALYTSFVATQAGAFFSATSSTSLTVGTGSMSLVLAEASQRAFTLGSPVRIADSAAPSTNYMDGMVTAYAHPNLTVDVGSNAGSGTKASWSVALLGVAGVVPIISGGTGATTAGAARTNLGLGTAATSAIGDFATAAQGAKADGALLRSGGTMTGAIDLANNNITGIKLLSDNGEIANTPSGGAATIDFSAGRLQVVTLNGATIVLTVSNPQVGFQHLRIKQDGIGGRAVTWAGTKYSATRWGGSAGAPSLNANANGESMATFYYDGTTMMQTLFRVGMT